MKLHEIACNQKGCYVMGGKCTAKTQPAAEAPDNPDQRIQEDVRIFVESGSSWDNAWKHRWGVGVFVSSPICFFFFEILQAIYLQIFRNHFILFLYEIVLIVRQARNDVMNMKWTRSANCHQCLLPALLSLIW